MRQSLFTLNLAPASWRIDGSYPETDRPTCIWHKAFLAYKLKQTSPLQTYVTFPSFSTSAILDFHFRFFHSVKNAILKSKMAYGRYAWETSSASSWDIAISFDFWNWDFYQPSLYLKGMLCIIVTNFDEDRSYCCRDIVIFRVFLVKCTNSRDDRDCGITNLSKLEIIEILL